MQQLRIAHDPSPALQDKRPCHHRAVGNGIASDDGLIMGLMDSCDSSASWKLLHNRPALPCTRSLLLWTRGTYIRPRYMYHESVSIILYQLEVHHPMPDQYGPGT